MSHSHDHDPTVPPGALVGAAVLILTCLAMTAAVTNGYLPKSGSPELSRAQQAIAQEKTRTLFFADTAEGGVEVTDSITGETVLEVPYGEGGFLRASLRRLVKERRARGIGAETPFTLILWENGALSLDDPTTGKKVEIQGFGPDHTNMFASMIKGSDS
ncbi:photosynthetic complex assembly protein PuhC [Alterisphingorhabdus coralli]|uniref:Photosynthetic complex assembly protein PuhC n=1 Tax=Alterisphingorhabdus coralli TaxID=3071408 RepID=A0AA97F6W2_9SPHN|nr:photosynthetic complex assembly protein PuhC [Parasphingorhabdus sp. SCSIO 66989]WOE74541.1 photosynthetic complex assembly protein PuhC [Parasphingorhabdus sp. SCSIO 66989]